MAGSGPSGGPPALSGGRMWCRAVATGGSPSLQECAHIQESDSKIESAPCECSGYALQTSYSTLKSCFVESGRSFRYHLATSRRNYWSARRAYLSSRATGNETGPACCSSGDRGDIHTRHSWARHRGTRAVPDGRTPDSVCGLFWATILHARVGDRDPANIAANRHAPRSR